MSNGRRDIFLRDFLPSPTLTINHATGQPGSIFALDGIYYPPNQSVAVWVNGVLLGQTTSDNSGNLHFRLQSQPSSDSGAYFITTQIDTFSSHASFYLDRQPPPPPRCRQRPPLRPTQWHCLHPVPIPTFHCSLTSSLL